MTIFTVLLDGLTLMVCILATSCGHETPQIPIARPDVTPSVDSNSPSSPSIIVVATATPTPAPISITYYSKTVTRQPNPNKFYTATGYCLAYGGKTYCWDDGVQIIDYGGGTIGHYSYWELAVENLTTTQTPVTSPLLVNQAFTNNILPGGGSVAQVNAGTAATVSCTDDGSGVLVCPGFSVDTNQVGL